MNLTLDQFDYDLPQCFIAQSPAQPRDSSKLMVVNRKDQSITHHIFSELPSLLDSSFTIVRNDTKVFPARIFAKKQTGGKVELLLHKKISESENSVTWECMTKPGLKLGQHIELPQTVITGTCTQAEKTMLTRQITFTCSASQLISYLESHGHVPIPPYVTHAEHKDFSSQYQTTYATHTGSVAAPTAGLHFTSDVDNELLSKGVDISTITLHVGMGTFLPVTSQTISDHQMHAEFFSLSNETADKLNQAKKMGKKILTVGTTTTRTLEYCATEKCKGEESSLQPQNSETEIFIYPGYEYKYVDAILTNFHLPKSTLLMMISAFATSPTVPDQPFTTFCETLVGKAYDEAKKHNYRFYSFGDAMLIV